MIAGQPLLLAAVLPGWIVRETGLYLIGHDT